MTNEELDALEQLARAATPGPWTMRRLGTSYAYYTPAEPKYQSWEIDSSGPMSDVDAAYIAAANPAAVLDLIKRVRELAAIAADVDRAMEAVRKQAFEVGQRQALLTLRGDPPQVE